MSLSEERVDFSTSLAMLVLRMNSMGVDVAIDFVKRCSTCPVGHPQSTHRVGLAADLNFYIEGKWLNDTHPRTEWAYTAAHDYWDMMGGAERIPEDLNHFSREWMGIR